MQENRNGIMSFPPPIRRDMAIWEFPKCYTPEASLQLKKDWDIKAKVTCKDRAARHQLGAALSLKKCILKDMETGIPASTGRGDSIKSDYANLDKATSQDPKIVCC